MQWPDGSGRLYDGGYQNWTNSWGTATVDLPLAPTGDWTVIVDVWLAPPEATVTVPGGVNEALQPVELPWNVALRV